MTLLYLANSRLPTEKAHGKQIVKTCAALADTGIQVTLIHPSRENPISADLFSYYGVSPTFQVRELAASRLFLLRKIGFALSHILFTLKARIRLGAEWDHVYTRDPLIALLGGILFPSVVWEAHQPQTGLVGKLLSKNKRVQLVAITQGIIDAQHAHGRHFSKELVAADAADPFIVPTQTAIEALRTRLALPPTTRIMLYAGSIALYPWKGVDTLLEIAKALPTTWKIVILGGTTEQIRAWQQKDGSERCLWHPAVPPTEVRAWYGVADAFVLPNRAGYASSERYTSPMKLFEYLAAGKPILASKLPSIQEVVNDDEVWFMDPEHPTPDALAFIQALEHGKGASLVQQALHKSQSNTWQARAQRLSSFLSTIPSESQT